MLQHKPLQIELHYEPQQSAVQHLVEAKGKVLEGIEHLLIRLSNH